MKREATKPGFNFLYLFCFYNILGIMLHVCFCCVMFSIFSTVMTDWLGMAYFLCGMVMECETFN